MAINPLAESIMLAEDRRITRLIDAAWEHYAIIYDGIEYILLGYDGSGSDLKTAINEVTINNGGELISLVRGQTLKDAHNTVQELNNISEIMNS
jgi:hypothetical protein